MKKPEPQVISVSILRDDLGRTLDRVKLLKESYIITKHGFPQAMLVPVPIEEPKTQT